MNGVFAYMSKPSKSGKRRYVYQNYNTHEYSFHRVPGVEYKESKLVYSTMESLKRLAEILAKFPETSELRYRWKEI